MIFSTVDRDGLPLPLSIFLMVEMAISDMSARSCWVIPNGTRAVAGAIGANGISIFIPCHRVIGSNHLLTGFAGGLDAKRRLLELEAEQKQHKT